MTTQAEAQAFNRQAAKELERFISKFGFADGVRLFRTGKVFELARREWLKDNGGHP